MTNKPIVLLAEDDKNDQWLLKRVLQRENIEVDLRIVENGQQAINYLSGSGEYADRKKFPLPQLILLDIKMPYKSGLEVLEWIRKDGQRQLIPVVIMSASHLQPDIDRAYQLGVNAYLVKPSAFDELASMFKTTTEMFVYKAAQPTSADRR